MELQFTASIKLHQVAYEKHPEFGCNSELQSFGDFIEKPFQLMF